MLHSHTPCTHAHSNTHTHTFAHKCTYITYACVCVCLYAFNIFKKNVLYLLIKLWICLCVLALASLSSRAKILMQIGIIAAHAIVIRLLLIIATRAHGITHWILWRCGRHHWRCGATWRSGHWIWRGACRLLGRIQICLLLCLANVLLIANALVAKPIRYLRHLYNSKHIL